MARKRIEESCKHSRSSRFRVPYGSASGSPKYRIGRMCLECGANANGPGIWIAEEHCPEDPAMLPIFQVAAKRKKENETPLFPED